ncbi:hypothetical protein C8D99_104161 [Aminivibrio pyruvatiphilus]|jgi:hypothetical protein|uniref:Uncharacterized protein n=1 Tax=Aminivibrio pyruvatiphilus TaxID=1005740 RepID=A0A4R8MDM3_9BACT|nr:hypothetical protein [Aminivibrio pyruvatiphilus]TDY61916.1 hypothetical protein C8D99_104161 [Aminivibrio pyruvatiphilus]
MMWIKDANGNWYCDGPLCTCSPKASACVWDKTDDGSWFLAQSAVPVSIMPSLHHGSNMILAG